MNADTDAGHRGGSMWPWGLLVVGVLLLYPLSVGPVVVFLESVGAPDFTWDIVGMFYWPLSWLYENGPRQFQLAMDWYLNFFNFD